MYVFVVRSTWPNQLSLPSWFCFERLFSGLLTNNLFLTFTLSHHPVRAMLPRNRQSKTSKRRTSSTVKLQSSQTQQNRAHCGRLCSEISGWCYKCFSLAYATRAVGICMFAIVLPSPHSYSDSHSMVRFDRSTFSGKLRKKSSPQDVVQRRATMTFLQCLRTSMTPMQHANGI